jgi:hypothetical protein
MGWADLQELEAALMQAIPRQAGDEGQPGAGEQDAHAYEDFDLDPRWRDSTTLCAP